MYIENDTTTYGYGHTTLTTPLLVRSVKLSGVRLSQYWGRRRLGNGECSIFFTLTLYFYHHSFKTHYYIYR